jgi:hypothetical protein
MSVTAIVYYFIFTALSAYFTSVAVRRRGAKELNPLMRLLLKSPPLFWVAQIILFGVVVYCIQALGPWFAFLAVSARAIVAYNDYLVYRG